MAYAHLIFPPGTPVLGKLKDIAKFCSGNITNVMDLEFAIPNNSEIVLVEPPGWSLISSTIESRGLATKTDYTLMSKCLDASKVKYCGLITSTNFTTTSSALPSQIKPSSSSIAGVLYSPISSSIVGGKPFNPCFYVNVLNPNSTNTTFSVYSCVDLSSRSIYISCSSRKLFIFSESTFNSFISNLEFPETQHTRANKNLPVLSFSASDIGRSALNANVNVSSGYVRAISSSTVIVYNVSAFHNWYSTVDGLRQNRIVTGIFNQDSVLSPIAGSINKNGYPSVMFYPLVDIRHSQGEETHFYSSLTDIYLSSRPPTFVSSGMEVTMNNETYTLLNSGTSASTFETIAVKKA